MRPLDGIKVLDFSRVLAGPMATQILAELGADVIKVERPGTGDESRAFEPRWADGSSAYFTMFNRGKRSVTLDLKRPEGAAIARALALRSDVVVENFLPGTMAGFGLGAEALRAEAPGLVYVSVTGFGQDGPDAGRPGYDTVFQALSGATAMTGQPGGPPTKVGLPFADLTSGLWIVIAVLTGLMGRARHGAGDHVDLAMMDVALSLLSIPAARLFALDEDPPRVGSGHHGRVPSNAYEARGGWVQISASDQHWPALCAALGLGAMGANPSFARNADRVARRAEVDAAIAGACAGTERGALVATLGAAGVPAGEILTIREALDRPQARHRGNRAEVAHPSAGPVPGLRTPGRFAAWDDPEPLAPPLLGDATDEVLRALGHDDAAIAALRAEGHDMSGLRVEGPGARGLLRVTLARPQARNAVDLALCEALRGAFDGPGHDPAVRAVLIAAEGPVFCAGADLKERAGKDAAWVAARRRASFAAYAAIEACPAPVIAALDGPVIGSGGEVAMAADFALASPAVRFRWPEAGWGTIGATQRLPRCVGAARGKELLLTGREVGPEEALSLGLIARLGDLAALVAETLDAILAAPPLAARLTKRAVDLGLSTGPRPRDRRRAHGHRPQPRRGRVARRGRGLRRAQGAVSHAIAPAPTVPAALARAALLVPDLGAIVGPDGRASFAELARRVDGTARRLAAWGVRPGERVALCLGNGVRWAEAFFALARLGAVTVPVNTRLTAPEVGFVLRDSGAARLILGARVLSADFAAMLPAIRDEAPGLRHVLMADGAAEGATPWDALRGDAPLPDGPGPGDDLLIQYTSGTTAFPKGVPLTHGQMLANGYVSGLRLGLRPGARLHAARPFFHVAGTTLVAALVPTAPRRPGDDGALRGRRRAWT